MQTFTVLGVRVSALNLDLAVRAKGLERDRYDALGVGLQVRQHRGRLGQEVEVR